MEGLKVDGRMKVKTLKENFKKTFGYTLRVYNTQNHFVDEELLLADVRQDDSVKTGEFSIDPEWTIDEFERNFKDAFAILSSLTSKLLREVRLSDEWICDLEEDKVLSLFD